MVFLFIYLFITAIGTIVELILLTTESAPMFPSDIYESTKLNWFGCWFLYILLAVCSPWFFGFKMLAITGYYIGVGIKYLFTVGRKDD